MNTRATRSELEAKNRSLATLGMTAAGARFADARKWPSLFVFDVDVFCIDHAFVFLRLTVAVG